MALYEGGLRIPPIVTEVAMTVMGAELKQLAILTICPLGTSEHIPVANDAAIIEIAPATGVTDTGNSTSIYPPRAMLSLSVKSNLYDVTTKVVKFVGVTLAIVIGLAVIVTVIPLYTRSIKLS